MLGTQRVKRIILWSHNYLLEVIPVIPVDNEAFPHAKIQMHALQRHYKCDKRNELTDTHCVDHLNMLLYGHVCHHLKGLNFHILKITSISTFLKTMISFVFHYAMVYIFKVTWLTSKKRELFILTLCVQIPLKILHLKRLQPYYLAKLTSYMNLILRRESNLTQTVVEFG